MNKKVYLIKNKLDSTKSEFNKRFLENAEQSLRTERYKYYNPIDDVLLKDENISKIFIMIISYEQESAIDSIYIGDAELVKKNDDSGNHNIKYWIKKCVKNRHIIKNLIDNIDLSLTDDYDTKNYILESSMTSLVNQIEELLSVNHCKTIDVAQTKEYADDYDTYTLAEYAQHNKHCQRVYNIRQEAVSRNEYQRDRERIVNSKAFRRLVDKAQIFSAEKGDHYRTRMTHTLEVNQIAKAIAVAINLNLDLIEAIALGHDIGHTPFGHQGERTLKEILLSDIEEIFHIHNIGDTKAVDIFGGFKHNYQSIRVLTKLEEKYIEYSGLDISQQVLEGILKHTKFEIDEVKNIVDSRYADGFVFRPKVG